MRIDPVEKIKLPLQERIDKTTKIVAITVAGLSTFVFLLKILFF